MKISDIFIFGAKKRFYDGWCHVFKNNAKIYNGMFSSLKKLSDGKAKQTEKIVKELCHRTAYNIKDFDTKEICSITTEKISESNKKAEKWIALLSKAIKDASIHCGPTGKIILDESNSNDYIEWDCNEIFVGDTVEIINPAWYQNGVLIEQGHCSIVEIDGNN